MDDKKSQEISSRPPQECSPEHLRALRKRAQAALATHRDRMTKLERQLTGKLDEISGALAEQWATDTADAQQAEQTYEDAQRLRKELEQSQADWRKEQEEITAAIAKRQHELDQQNAELDERAAQFEARHRELAEREEALLAAQQELVNQRRDLELQQSASSTEKSVIEAERTELQHKFELALDDVRRLRRRTAELEQELARRPEGDDDSLTAELAHLRAERDGLVERIEELERHPTSQIDPDSQRQVADLQRRFELAVEDVRELKTQNAKLEARVVEAQQHSGTKADAGGMDWESQKRRMLDSLSDDFDPDDSASRRERATIEGTIRITDEVVTKKDDEIARLKEQLASQQHGAAEAHHHANVNQIVDADEVVQQHRARLAQLEKELQEKLRAAELELSVERAKMARKQVELNDWRAELETMQRTQGKGDGDGGSATGVPKRRWLSKLGLGGDEEVS